MIAIIDYGVGNLFSLESSVKKLGFECRVTSERGDIARADRIILPGVGAFGDAAKKLRALGLDNTIKREALEGKPLLGICLGMQLLFDRSFEYGEHEGLGLISGEVRPLFESVSGLKIPHMGWNSLHILKKNPLFSLVDEGEYVYFVHSYHAVGCGESLSASCFYGVDVTAAVQRENVFGVQFHPEKSGETGLKILKAFGTV